MQDKTHEAASSDHSIDPETLDHIKQHNWTQGSVLADGFARRIVKEYADAPSEFADLLDSGSIIVLASHPCDIQNMVSTNDLFVEAILGRKSGPPQKQKTVRSVVLGVTTPDGLHHWKFEERYRLRFPRKKLARELPDPNISLDGEESRKLARFLAKRYDRPAFPDAFEEALKPAREKDKKKDLTLDRLLRWAPHLFSGIYFVVTPLRELTDGERYNLFITGLMRSKEFASEADGKSGIAFHEDEKARSEADRLLLNLATLIQERCPRIDIKHPKGHGEDDLAYEVRSESELSVAEYRLMQYYDWDFLSPRVEELPAPQID